MSTSPTPPPPAAAPASKKGRGLSIGIVLLAVGLVLLIAGIGIGVWRISSLRQQQNRLVRVSVPTTQEVTLHQGTKGVWFEARSEVFVEPNNVSVTVTDPSTGNEIPIRTASSSNTFSSDGRFSRRVGVITVPRTGTYEIETDGTGAETVAIGNISVVQIALGIGVIVAGVLVGGLFMLAGGIVLIIAIIKRSNAKRLAA